MSIFANPSGDNPEGVQSYVKALLDLAGDADPIAELPHLPDRIESAIRGLDNAALHRREAEGKWSIAHVVQHLADSEVVYAFRFRTMLADEAPKISGYDQDRWANRLHYDGGDVAEALAQLRAMRRANVRLLASLTPEERQRGGMHSERGFETVERLMKLDVAHDIVHLRQIERIRKAVEGAASGGESPPVHCPILRHAVGLAMSTVVERRASAPRPSQPITYRTSSRIALPMAVAFAVLTFVGSSLCAALCSFLTGRSSGLFHIASIESLRACIKSPISRS